jgi:hypothetical protein
MEFLIGVNINFRAYPLASDSELTDHSSISCLKMWVAAALRVDAN